MISTRFRRLVGVLALVLAPSLGLAQTALQQPITDRSKGTVDAVPAAITKLYANDVYLQGLIGTRFGQLGGAAFLNVGTLAGTVADGGALTAEIARAQTAEQANATAIGLKAPIASPTFTGIPRAPTAATGATGTQLATLDFVGAAVSASGGGGQYAVTYTAQSLTAPQQLQARQNIGAAASGANTDIASLASPALGAATATTATAGTNTTQVATTAFSTGALMSYAGTVSATYAPLASPALTGTPTAPTAAAADNGTRLATTAFLTGAAPRGDLVQSLTSGAQDQIRANISGPASSAPASSLALTATDFDRPLFPTGSVTITVPNGGAGWRSGPIKNANAVTGLVTLAVPSGATLDGVANGTAVLFPYQRARIVQTSATAYAMDWIERSPIVAIVAASGVTSADAALPVGYQRFRWSANDFVPSQGGTGLGVRCSDNGTTNIQSGNSYINLLGQFTPNGAGAQQSTSTMAFLIPNGQTGSYSLHGSGFGTLSPGGAGVGGSAGSAFSVVGTSTALDGTPNRQVMHNAADWSGASLGRINLLRFMAGNGAAFNANITIWGEP